MEIQIFSDTICPWCFVGKRRLERALKERPQPEVTFRWRAFQLNPGMPEEGMAREEYVNLKFGGAENAAKVYDAVAEAGAAEGIAFAFDKMKHTPNTVNSHRLIRYGELSGKQEEIVQGLFDRYFLEGLNIGDTDVLVQTAEAAGMDGADVRKFLEGDLLREEILAEDAAARRAGINGVPCFIYAGRYALPGAQPPEVLHQMFDVARAEEEKASVGGESA